MRIAGTAELRAKLDMGHVLLTSTIEITRRCNLRCVHCLRNLDNDDGLTFPEISDVLDQLVALGCMNLTFTGGEPFTRRDFMDIARYAWAKRLAVVITTNGTLLTAEVASELKRLHVRELQISLYSIDPAIHDAITLQPGSHKRTLAGIDLARENGLKVRVATPLMAMNADQSPAVEAFCAERGLKFLPGSLIFPRNGGDRQPLDLLASNEQMAHIAKHEAVSNCDGQAAVGQQTAAPPLCSAGRDRLGIGADGAIYPCDAMRIPLGNVRNDRLADIWFGSQRLAAMRLARRQHPSGCDGCSAKNYCVWCPGLSLDLHGDPEAPNAQDCRRTRLSFARVEADAPGWLAPEFSQ